MICCAISPTRRRTLRASPNVSIVIPAASSRGASRRRRSSAQAYVTRALRGIPILVVAFLAVGCVPDFLKRRPPLEQYILRLPATENGVPSAAGPPVLTGTLAIAPFVTRGI